MCSDFQDCSRGEYVFGGYGKGVYLSVYGIKDARMISEIISTVSERASNLSVDYPVVVSFYYGSHGDYLGLVGIFKKPDIVKEIK
ncbi:hypothetical protein D3C81_1814170 [compost metagenome]